MIIWCLQLELVLQSDVVSCQLAVLVDMVLYLGRQMGVRLCQMGQETCSSPWYLHLGKQRIALASQGMQQGDRWVPMTINRYQTTIYGHV